ncbi:MAG: TldD/PmbA family protein [Planctomycetota bacterium]|jgi:PmbA protein
MGELSGLCAYALETAKEAVDLEAFAVHSVSREVKIEKNDIHMATSEEVGGIGIRAFREKALGFAFTNSPDKQDIAATVGNAIEIAGVNKPDDANILPEKQALPEVTGLYEPAISEVDINCVLEYAQKLLSSARDFDKRVTIDAGSVSVSVTNRAIANSNGIVAEEKSGIITYFIWGMAKDGEDISSFQSEFDFSRTPENVNVETVGKNLAEKVIASLGAAKGESFRGPVLFSPEASIGLLCYPVIFSVNADHVQKGRSRWKNKVGEKVASEMFTMHDNGLLPGGVATSAFDREGVPRREFTVIRNGVLQGYMYDVRTASRDDTSPTGHAGGGTRGVPGIGPTNVTVKPGGTSVDDIIAGIDKGILINRFSGGPNVISGDYSGVVKGGFLIKNGKIDCPLTGTLVHGNIYEAYNKIAAVSKETKKYYSFEMPHFLIDDVSVTCG